ncbi:MAG: aldose epimerase, partial [Cyanobacteria bacterium J083]
MYTIDKQQAQYETYILSDEINHSRLEVVPARGGIITRWRIQGQNILYFDAERFSQPNLSLRGGIPILFPICGNLPHNSYTHQGKTYQLKQHGFARDLPWEVIATETQESAQMILQLTSNDYTLRVYPFAFSLRFTYQLQGNKLTILQVYENLSQETMKFSCGFHPYFLTEDK